MSNKILRWGIKIAFALGLLLLWLSPWTPSTAETTVQMRVRIFEEAKARHPDVWAGCGQECVQQRLISAPMLVGLAQQTCSTPGGVGELVCVDLGDLVRYSIVRDYEWGWAFEDLYKRRPTIYDWIVSYPARLERLRYELATSPMMFAQVSEDDMSWRLRREYKSE